MELESLFRKNKGIVKAEEIRKKRMNYYNLDQLIEEGTVLRLRKGLYKHVDFAKHDYLSETSMMYPKAVICMYSAAFYYNLTTHIPSSINLAIGRKDKLKLESYPSIDLYYWSDKYYHQHIESINGFRIYSVERTICDLIRLKYKSDIEIVKEVCVNYIAGKNCNLNLLLKIAEEIGVQKKVATIFEILI